MPICQRQEGLCNSGEKLAPVHYIRSEFLERNLCQALCKIIYAMILMSKSVVFLHFYKFFESYFQRSKNNPVEILTGGYPL